MHRVARDVSLQSAYDELLTAIRLPNLDDSQDFTSVLLSIREHLEHHPDATCTVYEMSKDAVRERGVNDRGQIEQLFQGPYPDRHGAVYAGDRQMVGQDGVTIQLHRPRIIERGSAGTRTLMDDVPVVAVWVSEDVAHDLIIQQQGS